MEVAIVAIVVVAALLGWWLLNNQSTDAPSDAAVLEEFDVRPPTSLDFDGSTAIATFDLEVADDGPEDALRDLLVKQAREALRGKGVDVDTISIRAWRGGHVTEVASVDVSVASADVESDPVPEAADFDPLGDLHATSFENAPVQRTVGELASIGKELSRTAGVREMLSAKGVDTDSMTMTQMTIALLESTGYSVSTGSIPGTYDATKGGSRTFLTIVDHEKGDYPELDEEAVESFVIRFVSSGADRGLLFTDKYGPFAVYDKEKRESRIKFMTRERLQTFVDSILRTYGKPPTRSLRRMRAHSTLAMLTSLRGVMWRVAV